MFPVFSLVLDQDVKPEMALLYPELYKDLTKVSPISISSKSGRALYKKKKKRETRSQQRFPPLCPPQGRSLSFKTFLIWVLISVYQGK